MEMEEKRNYIKEYYSKKDHDLKELVKNIDLSKEDEIKKIKAEINKLAKQVEEKKTELQNKVDTMYSKTYIPINKKIILRYDNYRGRNNATYTYDLGTGYIEDDYDNENSMIYRLDYKTGDISIVVGYDYELASIIVKNYHYNISNDYTKINTKFMEQIVIPFLEEDGVKYDATTNEISTIQPYWRTLEPLEKITDKEFINTLYGVDYKGSYSLKTLRERNHKNKSFEIILKTAPQEIVDYLLNMDIETCIPIHKIIGISQETYNTAIQRNMIKLVCENKDYISGKNNEKYGIEKTEKEWIDFIDEIKGYQEDMDFYNIRYTNGYYYYGNNGNSLLALLLNSYSQTNVFKKYYSLGKFTNYVVNETINQGYESVSEFIQELGDYLKMCDADDIKPTLYSSYLKQTHDITSRNHKIMVEKESETIFKNRYKDFRVYNNHKYMVIAPKCSEDLKREGDNLNHCVASYIKRVIDGECLIYFLRKNKDESLITFEVRNDRIVQVRGLHNRKPIQEEIDALKDFATKRKLELSY